MRVASALFVLTAAWCMPLGNWAQAESPPNYEQDVRPILKTNCFQCHGELAKLQGGLDLRLQRLILKGGETGAAVKPHDPDHSLLLARVRDGEMPPAEVKKKLTAQEVETIRRWIAAGAPTLREEPADADPNLYLTEEERNFWSFRPIQRGMPPTVREVARVRTAIDRFVLARLEAASLSLSPEADRPTVARRLFIDLLGVPPTPEDVAEFQGDPAADAYERLVDRLLASPRYGERWGRHWLDVAGYADSEGYRDDDVERPDAWKYRDYVLRAFNADKPFDRFVQEQLAGDELIGRALTNLSPDEVELLTATGFLRMAPDGTTSSAEPNVARNDVVAKTIEIVSTSLLGLTVGCAQCHNHRYDPISQDDYYAFRAVFEPALNWKEWLTPAGRRVSLYTDADRQQAAAVEEQAKQIEAQRTLKQEEFIQRTLEKELVKLPAELHAALRAARSTAEKERTAEQKKLLQTYPSVNVSAGSLYLYDQKAADELKKMADEAKQIRAKKPKEEFVRALWEPASGPPKTFLFHRGQPEQPKHELPPRPPAILAAVNPAEFPIDDPSLPTSGRRLALARWLTSPRQPLTARVFVNRLWMHHFGIGLAPTPGDFGVFGARPTNLELLDWLAAEFIDGGWSVKRLQRLIVTSTAYRQVSRRNADGEARDPDNHLLWRMPVRRIDAESLRDGLLTVSGRLNFKSFGQPVPVMADNVGQFVIGIENLDAGRPGAAVAMHGEEFRRSVYVQVRRSRPLSVLDPFDLPRMEPNCAVRSATTVAPQSLLLMNNDFVAENATALAERCLRDAGRDVLAQVRRAWTIVYSTEPTADELSASAQYVLDQALHFATHPPEAKPAAKPDPQVEALATLCHALLSSNRFLYVD